MRKQVADWMRGAAEAWVDVVGLALVVCAIGVAVAFGGALYGATDDARPAAVRPAAAPTEPAGRRAEPPPSLDRPLRPRRPPIVVQARNPGEPEPGGHFEDGSPGDPNLKTPTEAERRRQLRHLEALAAEQQRVATALQQVDVDGLDGGGALIWPVRGPVTSGFGPRWGRHHAGIDIGAPAGTPIVAAEAGRVVLLGTLGGYGRYTCIQHTRRLSTCYAHQSRYATSPGAAVRRGQLIGYVGCTGHCYGDHLHFEVRMDGRSVDPVDYL